MKSLFKISSRYVLTAAFLTVMVLSINIITILLYGSQIVKNVENSGMGRYEMESIEQEISVSDTGYILSEEGEKLIQNSSCLWAMRLNKDGDVVWEYRLPANLKKHYTLSDVAVFSRWYLDDYPVFIWKNQEELMVYGVDKNIARFDFYGDIRFWGRLPQMFYFLIIFNLCLIAGLALIFGFRFYRALRPVAKGIEQLSEKEVVQLSEKGLAGDLIRQLNRTSVILQVQNHQLEKRDQARTEWIAGVSHDVRTPLSLIMGFSDDLANDFKLSEEQKKKAELIREQSQRIKALISDLNLTVKLEYQSQPLRKEEIYPAKLLREIVADFYNQNMDDKFQIIPLVQKEAEKAVICVDKQLIFRVFQNLIGNSLRHNPDGCEVEISMSLENNEILLLFSDSGKGVPENVVEILEGRVSEAAEVHIMGLRIVMQIVKAHNGKMEFVKGKCEGYHILIKFVHKLSWDSE